MSEDVRRALVVLLGASTFALLTAGAAGAAITPVANDPAGATAIANAMASTPGVVTGALFVAAPPLDSPNGTANSALTQFPTNGSTFGILTSGSVANADDPGLFTSVNLGGGNVRGNTDFDVSILQINLDAPLASNCLTFDFKFLSEEYPFYVGSQFNDAFIAELDVSNWTTSGSTITAPNNFAFDASDDVVSVNSTGIGGITQAQGAGTTYDGGGSTVIAPPAGGSAGGGTVLLSASTQITPGLHSLYLSIFDQGDQILRLGRLPRQPRCRVRPRPGGQLQARRGAETVPALTDATERDQRGRRLSHRDGDADRCDCGRGRRARGDDLVQHHRSEPRHGL